MNGGNVSLSFRDFLSVSAQLPGSDVMKVTQVVAGQENHQAALC